MPTLNPVTELITALTGKMNQPIANSTEIIELDGRETYRLEAQQQVIWVLSGCAWISMNGQDQVVREGEDVLLKPGKDGAIISSLNCDALVFEIRYV